MQKKETMKRELDAAVAERVMDWKRVKRMSTKGYDAFSDGQVYYFIGGCRAATEYECDHPEEDIFAPSSEISAAMQVVEKMVAAHYSVKIEKDDESDAQWDVEFELWDYAGESSSGKPAAYGGVIDESLSIAVCLAALQAIREEGK